MKAKESGADVTFRPGTGMLLCYPLMAPIFKEATEVMNEIVSFIRRTLQRY